MLARRTVYLWTLPLLVQTSVCAQAVVSVRSGVVNFFEGSVLIDGQHLQPQFGKYYDVKEGSKLETEDGRAELLMMPGALLRVGEESSVRMVSTRLDDTRVEFIGGETALDTRNAAPSNAGIPLRVVYKDYEIRCDKPGSFVLSSAPAVLRVREGEAHITRNGKSVVASTGQSVALTGALEAQTMDVGGEDSLERWADERTQTLTAANQVNQSSDDISGTLDAGLPPGSIFDVPPPVYAPMPGSVWVGGMPAGYWGAYSVSPLIFGAPGLYYGIPSQSLWRGYHNAPGWRPTPAWHPIPRGNPTFRSPSPVFSRPIMPHPGIRHR